MCYCIDDVEQQLLEQQLNFQWTQNDPFLNEALSTCEQMDDVSVLIQAAADVEERMKINDSDNIIG